MSGLTTRQVLSAASGFLDDASRAGEELMSSLRTRTRKLTPKRCSSCDIPPPCWMPRRLDEVTSHVCAGSQASVRIRITNCGVRRQQVRVLTPYDDSVTISPEQVTLGPYQSAEIELTSVTPRDAARGSERRILVVVQGCNTYVFDWLVTVDPRGRDSAHEVEIDDCPDLVHHWYDHFYCQRPCGGGKPHRG